MVPGQKSLLPVCIWAATALRSLIISYTGMEERFGQKENSGNPAFLLAVAAHAFAAFNRDELSCIYVEYKSRHADDLLYPFIYCHFLFTILLKEKGYLERYGAIRHTL